MYVGNMLKIPMGRMKYSAMVNDDACLVDDGVLTKTGENDFYFTASTGRAGMTSEWIRYQCLGEDWEFHIVNLTDTLGAINVAGPNSRAVLQKLTDADLSDGAFPYLGYRELLLCSQVRSGRCGWVLSANCPLSCTSPRHTAVLCGRHSWKPGGNSTFAPSVSRRKTAFGLKRVM